MPIADIATKAAKAGGATAGLGVGGGLSYGFFNEAHGGELIQRGDAYGLTAFAFIALFLLIASLIALPQNAPDQLRKALYAVLAVFGLLAVSGFVFRVFLEDRNPQVAINATFSPNLDHLNSKFSLAKDLALSASLNDHHGHIFTLPYDKDVPVTVQEGWELTIDMDQLPDALTHTIEKQVARSACADPADCGGLAIAAGENDDVGSAH
jgi:hypothetical protein